MATPRKPTPPTTTEIDAFRTQFDLLFNFFYAFGE